MRTFPVPPLFTKLGYDFDVLVGGHLTRLGTKEDAQIKVDYFADILAGAELGISTVMVSDIVMGTGIGDPTNPNFGNTWCVGTILILRMFARMSIGQGCVLLSTRNVTQ